MIPVSDKVVGIIGGLGPAATFDFCQRIVRLTEVDVEQDHLQLLVDNNPKAADRNQALAGNGPTPEASFAESARRLENAGADFLVMPCNTAHAYADVITSAASVPFINVVDETVAEVTRRTGEDIAIGLLAADGCLQAGLYQDRLSTAGYRTLLLDSAAQKRLMEIIYRIKQNGVSDTVRSEMIALATVLETNGAGFIIAGCTEVPLVLQQEDVKTPLFDTTEWLATLVVEYAKNYRSLNLAAA